MIDVAAARADTPGCSSVLHFNNAGAALMPRPVLDAVKAHLDLEARIGGYEAARVETAKWERTYDALAVLLGCARDEIAIVENATRAWDMAFYALPLGAGDRILTGRDEYASNYMALLQVARKTGAVVDVVPDDGAGQIDVAALERMIDGRVKLIALTHIPTNGGLVNPAAAVGKIARAHGVPYLLDACQSAGQLPLDVDALGCDMLTATGRKFLRGPRGTGFLYVRRAMLERLEPPFVDLHAATWTSARGYEWRPDARRFENWETNYATKIGLAVAVDYALGIGIEAIGVRCSVLGFRLREALAGVPGVSVHDLGAEKCAIVTFTVEGIEGTAVRDALLEQAINTSVAVREAALIDMEARGLHQLVRASVHYYNTDEEIARFVAAVRALARAPARAAARG